MTRSSSTTGLMLSLFLVGSLDHLACGFLQQLQHTALPNANRNLGLMTSFVPRSTFAADGDREKASGGGGGGAGWNMDALRSRLAQYETEKWQKEKNWREAACDSGVRLSLPDGVRRLDVQYPLAACGTSVGTIYLAHLETGEILAEGTRTQGESVTPAADLDRALYHMFGKYDGDGTVAIAFREDLICEANRDGGVNCWRLDSGSTNLVYQGSMKALEGILVTCLHLDEEFLWIGSADGKLQAFPLDADFPLAIQTQPELRWQFRSMILSLSLTPAIGCGVVTTVEGTVELISLDDDGNSLCSFYPPYDDDDDDDDDDEVTKIHALSAVLVAHKSDEDERGIVPYSIAVGGNDGSLMLQPLEIDEDGELDAFRPFASSLRRFKPRHKGPVKCLASPIPGLLISASHDGSMRVWDIAPVSHCIYQFVGYTTGLGSLWADGSRIVSDGSDNTVIVHDFENEGFPEDHEDDKDDFEEDFR